MDQNRSFPRENPRRSGCFVHQNALGSVSFAEFTYLAKRQRYVSYYRKIHVAGYNIIEIKRERAGNLEKEKERGRLIEDANKYINR